jgi:hypothetical protein
VELFGKCASEIKTYLDLVNVENALPYGTIARLVSMLEGRTNVRDDSRPGPLISVTSEKGISTVKAIIDKYARYTVEETSDISVYVRHVFSIWKKSKY